MVRQWIAAENLASATNELNPRDDFVLNMLKRFYPSQEAANGWHSAIFELDKGATLGKLIERVDDDKNLGDIFYLPNIYRQLHRNKFNRTYFTALLRPSGLHNKQRNSILDSIHAQLRKLGGFVPDRHLNLKALAPELSDISVDDNETVIMAIIDNGIAFGNSQFRDSNSSRIEHCWIMDAPPEGSIPVSLGRAFDKEDIDTLLAAHLHGGQLDDAEFYRAAGMVDHVLPAFKPVVQRISHGTHVMSLAAGNQVPAKPRPIICVQLPTIATSDPGGATIENAINLALDHVLLHAGRFKFSSDGKRPPLVITLSYGDFAGPHDGTGVVESFIDEKMRDEETLGRNTRIVLPAGNGNLARCHARLDFPKGTVKRTLNWRVQPDDRTNSLVDIRTPARAEAEIPKLIKVSVKPPGSPPSPAVGDINGRAYFLVENGLPIAVIYFDVPHPRERGNVQLVIAPTESLYTSDGLAPHGVWKFQVERGDGLVDDEAVHAWSERDETLPGFPSRGRQAYFEDSEYKRFNKCGAPKVDDLGNPKSHVRRSHTLSGFATGARADVVVVGAWNQKTGKMSPYSATGPTLKRRGAAEPNRIGPDAAAVADDSLVIQGIFGAGSISGSIVRLSGTSVATPQVARLLADSFGAVDEGDAGQQYARIKAIADEIDYTTSPPNAERGGGGRLKHRHRIGSKVG